MKKSAGTEATPGLDTGGKEGEKNMVTVEAAFLAGLESVRAAGLKAKGSDVAVLAASRVFSRRAAAVQADPRFEAEGPAYARRLILEAYAAGG